MTQVVTNQVGRRGNAETIRSFEPGIGRVNVAISAGDENTDYYHTNHLGTTRQLSDPNGAIVAPAVYTAFGERISGALPSPEDRYGYVGAHGYQGDEAFAFMHVAARYYDPASGRFLQRDPIGIEGGFNAYSYVGNMPTEFVDPTGEAPKHRTFRVSNTGRIPYGPSPVRGEPEVRTPALRFWGPRGSGPHIRCPVWVPKRHGSIG